MIASELGMLVSEMRRRISPRERRQWAIFFKQRHQEQERANDAARNAAQNEAAQNAKPPPPTMGRRG